MSNLDLEQVESLAPDAASLKAAKGLASIPKWVSVGSSERSLWGECKGSGKTPYQVRVDREDLATKCSCPSRKFPCKHALALLLLTAGGSVSDAEPPEWVTSWLEGRTRRAEAKGRERTPEEEVKAAKDKEKRQAKREDRITSGVEDLQVWIGDLTSRGLLHAQSQSTQWWTDAAKRLVDAQAPGLAVMVEDLGSVVRAGRDEWAEEATVLLARLDLTARAWLKRSELSGEYHLLVRSQVGLPRDGWEVKVTDEWVHLASSVEQEDRLVRRAQWLMGLETGRLACIVSHAPNAGGFEPGFTRRSVETATLGYAGERSPAAIVVERAGSARRREDPPALTIEENLQRHAALLGTDPWIRSTPVNTVGHLTPGPKGWALHDGTIALPVVGDETKLWSTLAEAGNEPVVFEGAWDGFRVRHQASWRKK